MVTLALPAMGTRFELVLHGEDAVFLRAAGEEALREIKRLEQQLSLYRDDSDISRVNAFAAQEPVRVEPRLFRLLQTAQRISAATGGAFDITVAPLMQVWGFVGGTGALPDAAAIEAAREVVGMQHVILNGDDYSVFFDRQGVRLDLGAIGKGYAIDQAIELLRDNEISSALLHGGTSSVYAVGVPPDADGWRIALQRPFEAADTEPLAEIVLKDAALSVSAPHNKGFTANGLHYGHVIDPRTGWPAAHHLLAALVTDSACEGDALSTALLTAGQEVLSQLLTLAPEAQSLLVSETADGGRVLLTHGPVWLETSDTSRTY